MNILEGISGSRKQLRMGVLAITSSTVGKSSYVLRGFQRSSLADASLSHLIDILKACHVI